jgi:hypothetical protein
VVFCGCNEISRVQLATGVSYTAMSMLQPHAITGETPEKSVIKPTIVDMYAVVTKDFADFRYGGGVTLFQPIKNGAIYAYQNGRPHSPWRGTLFFRRAGGDPIGEEVDYGPRGRSSLC